MQKLGWFRPLFAPVFAVTTSWRITSALREPEKAYFRFWRYRDVFSPTRTKDPIGDVLPRDRADPFHEIKELAEASRTL